VSPCGYHQNFTRKAQGPERARLSDDALLVHIKAIHAQSKGNYGWPRVHKELLAHGIRVGKERVRKLMQQHGIKARGKRRFKATTDSRHQLPVAPNLLGQRFDVASPDRAWAGDITNSPPTKAGCTWRWSSSCSAAKRWAGA
jgi:putative transposase